MFFRLVARPGLKPKSPSRRFAKRSGAADLSIQPSQAECTLRLRKRRDKYRASRLGTYRSRKLR